MPLVEFEPTITAGEQPQTHALDRVATEISNILSTVNKIPFIQHLKAHFFETLLAAITYSLIVTIW
jgi:hypothetical protein